MSGFSRRVLAALIVAAALFAAIAVASSASSARVAAFDCPGGTSWDNILHICH